MATTQVIYLGAHHVGTAPLFENYDGQQTRYIEETTNSTLQLDNSPGSYHEFYEVMTEYFKSFLRYFLSKLGQFT